MILSFLFIISLLLFSINIFRIILKNNNNNLIFYILSITTLTIGLTLLLFYYNNLLFSLILSFLLMIITFLFVLEIRNTYKYHVLSSLPFFIITIYLFAKVINLFLCLAHQWIFEIHLVKVLQSASLSQ